MKTSLFAYGFRPNFLLAGVAAVLLIGLWAADYSLGIPLSTAWPPTLWHSHEMVFGFVGAVIAGFLLTAVPSWTARRGFAGRPLVLLSALWVAARLLIATSGRWPDAFVAIADLAFFPVLAALIGPLLLRERNRNTPLLGVVALLWASNAAFHWALARGDAPLAGKALVVAIDIVLVLVTIIGGRILPAFTSAALKRRGIEAPMRQFPGLTAAAVGVMLMVLVADTVWPNGELTGWLAALAAAVQGMRLLQWRTRLTAPEPIVWVLHLSYIWLPMGFALKAIALLRGSAFAAFWLHALTVGATSTMILGMMTRVALGHTGRPLVVAPSITLAYGLLTAAAVTRVFGLALGAASYPAVILMAAALWMAAFGLFLWIYIPILCGPRADGVPG